MRKIFFLVYIGCAAFLTSGSSAQTKGSSQGWEYTIESAVDLKNGRLTLSPEPSYYLVLLKQGERQHDLVADDLRVYRKGADGFFIIKASSTSLLNRAPLFESVWQVNNRWKLSPNLLAKPSSIGQIFTIKSSATAETIHKLSGLPNLNIISVKDQRIKLSCSYNLLITRVISFEEVIYAGKEGGNPKTESRVTDLNLVANGINRIHHAYPDLNGKGMTLSLQENGFDAEDIDLLGRETASALRAPNNSLHATEMATNAAGAGNSFVTGKGAAWAANITTSDFADVLPDADKAYRELDAWVQNHSYGTEIENFYGALAEAFDKSATSNPALLHVISSGNQGMDVSTGTYEGVAGYANLTGNFKMAKNVLTIGAVDTVGRPMFFSSKGPAYDGRVKPELTAYSTAGTSNSTALVSGLVVLLQQAYKEQYNKLPASALLKALLINSARDAGAEGLDFKTGYGNVNGYKTLENLKAGRYFAGNIGHGETKTISLKVPANVQGLKLTLVWTDPSANPNSDVALVNDIDIQLEDGNKEKWLSWVLDGSPNVDSLAKPAVRAKDHLNNIEQITVEEPAAGTYTITISGYDIPRGPQEFYIAYQWEEENRFSWAYPLGSDLMPYNGESTGYFRWESSMAAASGRLEYSTDGGESWQLIDEAVDLKSGAYRWEAPRVHGLARARMLIGDNVFTTDRFALARPLKASVGFNCGDSLLIQWNKLENARQYQVFSLGEAYMEPVAVIADTLLVLEKQDFPTPYFAVQPIMEEGIPAIRSLTFDYALQGTQCYMSSFFSELTPGNSMYLNLSLGTTYGVEEILFERKVSDQWEVIGEASLQGAATKFRFPDKAPLQGLNEYRATLHLANGEKIVSQEDRNYYLTEPPLIVFPNPVSGLEGINVFTKNHEMHEFTFKLYSSMGRQVAENKLDSDREFIPLKNLQPGLYFYTVELEGKELRGRLIVE